MANRLAQETSPYLLQHRDNPVDWYPWGEEALRRARELDRPLLLSVGYSACHWCHVMERESFEDPATAAYMNEHFVCVKVDREERPDVDALYMEAVQAMSGHGGWPMTVFCDPDGVPFYGGTYFPPDESRGMPSFRMVMEAVVDAFAEPPRGAARAGAADAGAAGGDRRDRARRRAPGAELLEEALATLLESADPERGGFGGAPKFPPASALELLLARGETEHVERTLDAMMAGGIYDQLGGGFSRYSVDAAWLVPHFEKMLYDNALLARAYLHGWQALGHERYRRVCEETLDWVLREMRGPEGGFYSALDADSEGEEGRFYVWTPAEIREVLGPEAAEAIDFYGVTEAGNFEGRNVLHRAAGAAAPRRRPGGGAAGAARGARRAGPARPRRQAADRLERADDAALAEAGAALGREDYLDAARRCADFVLGELRDEQGACCAPTTTARPASTPTSRTTPSCWKRCSPSTRRASSRAGSSGGGAGGHDDRPLRRPAARRLLLDLRRPRGADRAPQGDRRPPDPLRQLGGGARPAAARRAERRALLRRAGGGRAATVRHRGAARARRLRPPAAGARLPAGPDQEVALVGDELIGWPRSSAPATAPTWSSPAAPRAARRRSCWPAARRSTARPPPTSASASPARRL